jgi:hypothetical protein
MIPFPVASTLLKAVIARLLESPINHDKNNINAAGKHQPLGAPAP